MSNVIACQGVQEVSANVYLTSWTTIVCQASRIANSNWRHEL